MKHACLARVIALGTVAGLAVLGTAGPVLAKAKPARAVSPAVNFFKSPLPIIGSTLSDSTANPYFPIKDGWSMYDPNGICSAYVQHYTSSTGWQTIWTFSGSPAKTRASGKYQWNYEIGTYQELRASATDCLSNNTTAYDDVDPSLSQEGDASYSAGWSTGHCACWSEGGVFKSSTVGAKANFSFTGRLVTFISDAAPNRGRAALYIDGKYQTTITLTSPTTMNRLLAWHSGYLTDTSHVFTVKVVSGHIHVDAFLVVT